MCDFWVRKSRVGIMTQFSESLYEHVIPELDMTKCPYGMKMTIREEYFITGWASGTAIPE
jgi:hypothetical protein